MTMTMAVTGATGHLGRLAVEALLRAAYRRPKWSQPAAAPTG